MARAIIRKAKPAPTASMKCAGGSRTFATRRLVTIADAGHMLHHDQPAAVAAQIEPFLRRLTRGAAARARRGARRMSCWRC